MDEKHTTTEKSEFLLVWTAGTVRCNWDEQGTIQSINVCSSLKFIGSCFIIWARFSCSWRKAQRNVDQMAGSPIPTNWSSIWSPSVQRSQSVSLIKYYFALCRVLGQVSCEVTQPKPNRPTEGQLFINLELSPMASPAFEAGRLVLITVITIRCQLDYWTLIWDITSNLILTFPIHSSLNSWTPFWSNYKLVNCEITKNYDMWTAELTYPYTHKKEIILLQKDSHCVAT